MKPHLSPFSARNKAPGRLSRWFWLGWTATILSLELIVLWLWLRRRSEISTSLETWEHPEILLPEIETATREAAVPVETTEKGASKPPTGDSERLERLDGIGPKVAGILKEAGIRTYAQLAQADIEHLRQIMQTNHLNFINPDTWPEQAQLAAGGRWSELEALQNELKGSRRTR
jgi:predicted flap endonuclease-1-like 5' DNA nuclease